MSSGHSSQVSGEIRKQLLNISQPYLRCKYLQPVFFHNFRNLTNRVQNQ